MVLDPSAAAAPEPLCWICKTKKADSGGYVYEKHPRGAARRTKSELNVSQCEHVCNCFERMVCKNELPTIIW